jgi:hypothetical protein
MIASRLSLLASLSLLVACSGASAGVGDPTGPAPDGSGSGTGSASPAGPDGTPTPTPAPADPGGPRVTIRAKGSFADFAYADGFSGETAKVQIAAIKTLYLLRSADDPSPVKVFDLGDSPALVDYATGEPATLATVALRSIPDGVYRRAKLGVSYVRYSVAARMHAGALPVDGQFDNVQALSDGAKIEGAVHKKGWYRYAFSAYGTTYGSREGDDAPTPATTTTGGVELDLSGNESFYAFPVDVAVDTSVTVDQDVLFEANVKDAFRWQDQALAGYAAGVFDATPSSYEPVMSFGASSYTVTFSRLQ